MIRSTMLRRPLVVARKPPMRGFQQREKASQAGTAATTATTVRPLPLTTRVWTAYTNALEKRPLTTKVTAASLIFFTSDTATQKLMDPEADWDLARASSGAVFGVIATTYLHFWWGFLERSIGSLVPVARSRLLNTAIKVFVDQSAGAPLYIYTYYIITNTVQKLSSDPTQKVVDVLEETESKARHMLWPTMLKHWRVWPAVHSLNFYFVPLQHRVLLQNTVLVGWSGYLSHLNKSGLPPAEEGKLMTPKEEIETTEKEIIRRKTVRAVSSQ